jgi:NADP-dependent 3-hydroxy acid dehydrogenase YdfG
MKTAFITGATSGFGLAIAKSLAGANYRLILNGRRKERLQDLSKELSSDTEVFISSFDVRDKSAVISAIKRLPEEWTNIDVLINNAGLALGKSFLEGGDTDDWDQMMDTNVKGLLYVTKALIPHLKKSDRSHIINIGSIAGTEVYPGGNVYCASKHAVNALSKAMRMELLEYGIRVSQVRPGLAETEFSVVRYKGNEEKAKKVYEGYQALISEDIARVTRFILDSPAHVCINDLEITPTAQANAFLIQKNS